MQDNNSLAAEVERLGETFVLMTFSQQLKELALKLSSIMIEDAERFI